MEPDSFQSKGRVAVVSLRKTGHPCVPDGLDVGGQTPPHRNEG